MFWKSDLLRLESATPFAQNCVSCNSRRKHHPDILKILFYINPRVPEPGSLLASRFDIIFTSYGIVTLLLWQPCRHSVGKSNFFQKPILVVHELTNVNSISRILRWVLYFLMAVSTSKPLAPPPVGPHACSPTRGEQTCARDQWLEPQDRRIQANY